MLELLKYSFIQNAIVSCLFTVIICAIAGTLVVVNRSVFITGGVAHASYGGIGFALWAGFPPLFGALGIAVFSGVLLGLIRQKNADKADALGFGLFVIAFEVFAETPDIHIKDSHLKVVFGVLLGDDGFLDGVHAADGTAVAVVSPVKVPGADALEESDGPRLLMITGADHMAHGGAGSAQQALKLQGGHDAGRIGIAVCFQAPGVEGLKAGGQDD